MSKKIYIVSNIEKDKDLFYTHKLESLLSEYDCRYSTFSMPESLPEKLDCDLIVTLGGDGTIIHVAQHSCCFDIPILGINLGRVGYLAEIETNEFDLISNYFSGNYEIDNRMMISFVDEEGNTYNSLNDVVISANGVSRMISLSLYCNGSLVSNYNSDALIICTPTGSTAYSMSAGGPIVDPSMKCLVSTPICSYSLTSRPTVFSADSVLKIVNNSREQNVYCTIDGSKNIKFSTNSQITISKSQTTAKFIRFKNNRFYELLGKKVN